MYAIIEDGSRQYRAEEGKMLTLDYRDGAAIGQTIELNKVLLLGTGEGNAKIGTPHVAGASVKAEIVGLPKVKTMTQKFRRRKASKRLKGHSQPHVRVKVMSVNG